MRLIGDQEFESVTRLDGESRYSYFVKQVADWRQLWSLRGDDGWVLASDDQGREFHPVWPHARYAEACATGRWAGTKPEPIDLEAWQEKWVPGMNKAGRLAAVFPTPDLSGVSVTSDALLKDLGEELDRIE